MRMHTRRLSSVSRTATPASTLPTVRETSIMWRVVWVRLCLGYVVDAGASIHVVRSPRFCRVAHQAATALLIQSLFNHGSKRGAKSIASSSAQDTPNISSWACISSPKTTICSLSWRGSWIGMKRWELRWVCTPKALMQLWRRSPILLLELGQSFFR